MDNSLTLARHFARLLWLLIHEGQSVDEQKVALRAVVFVSKEASVRLSNKEGRLAVNNLVMPQALAGVQELAERLVEHGISEIEIDEGARPSELLSLARLLAVGIASTSDVADFSQRLSQLEGTTVHVRLSAALVKAPERTGETVPTPDAPPLTSGERVTHLFAKLGFATTPQEATNVLEEIAFSAEQAAREGRFEDSADVFSSLLDRENAITDPEVRRGYVVTVRRLTKPVLLRPIAHLISSDPRRRVPTERILQRCGQDGVDAIIDQYISSTSAAERDLYRATLSRLSGTRDALVQMLQDPRWYVVRQAAEFLGELQVQDTERPLAEILRHQDARVRRAVARALSRLDSVFAFDALVRALTDESATVRLEAVSGLMLRRSAKAGGTLAKAIDDESDTEVQFAILAALGRVGSPEAVQKLTKSAEAASGFLKSKKNSGLRIAAVQALGEARTPGALTALQSLSNDKEKDVRDAVARAIADMRRSTSAA
jgi:HEAT repeat protein